MAQQPAQTEEKAVHGAWSVRCVTGNQDVCFITQQGKNDKGEPVLLVRIQKTPGLKSNDGRDIPGVMSIAAPLGVLLPAGLVAKIDGADAGATGYRFCDASACIIEEPVSQEFIAKMKKGSNVAMTIRSLNGQPTTITMSLSGFTKAFDSVK